jgi:hypothetical protein
MLVRVSFNDYLPSGMLVNQIVHLLVVLTFKLEQVGYTN